MFQVAWYILRMRCGEQAAILNLHNFFFHSIRCVTLPIHVLISYNHGSFCCASIYCDVLSFESTKVFNYVR